MPTPEITIEMEPSQLLVNNNSSVIPNNSSLGTTNPIQTYAFLDLETSGLNGSKITEFAVIAVSRYDLEKMQTRITTAIPLSQPIKTQSSSIHIKKNELKQNAKSTTSKVKRQLFTPVNKESLELDSNIATGVQVNDQINDTENEMLNNNISNALEMSENVDKVSEQPQIHEQEDVPSQVGVNVATDTVGLFPRRCLSNYYKVPELPRSMTKLTQLFNPRKLIWPETESISGLSNMSLEYYPVLSGGFCEVFKNTILNLPKPVCLVAHYGEKYDLPIIVSEFLHATNCEFEWGDVVYADSLEVLKLLDKIETHLEIQEINSQIDTQSDWFLDETVFDVPNSPPCKRRCADAPCTPPRPETSYAVHDTSCPTTPKQMVMSSPLNPCPETPVTPSNNERSNWSIQNRSPAPNSSLITPPSTPVAKTSTYGSRSCRRRPGPQSTHKQSLLYFPPNCSLKSMVQITMNHTGYNLGFPKYIRPFSQPNLYHRFFGRAYDAHRAEADCQALLQICGHYGQIFTKTVDIMKRPMTKIEPKMLTNHIVKNLNSRKDKNLVV